MKKNLKSDSSPVRFKFDFKTVMTSTANWVAGLVLLGTYLRLFYGTDVTDEAYHVAAASLTSLGASFYANDSYFGQTASLVYEPIVAIYRFFFGSFAIILFVRHLYFACAVMNFIAFERLFRHFISRPTARLVALIPLVFIPYSIPILSYNTVAIHGFGMGCALLLNAVHTHRRNLAWAAALPMALAVFAYPSFVIGVASLYLALAGLWAWQTRRWNWMLVQSATLAASLFLCLWGITLWRFDLNAIIHSMETTSAYGSLSRFNLKWDQFRSVIGTLTPPAWMLSLVLVSGIFLRWKNLSWMWNLPVVIGIYFATVPTPPWSLLSSPMISFAFSLSALEWLRRDFHKNSELDLLALATFLATATLGFAVMMTSSNHVLAMAFVVQYGLMLQLVRTLASADSQNRQGLLSVPLTCFLAALLFWNLTYIYRDDQLVEMDSWITTGPFAGILTSELRKMTLEEIESDLRKASVHAESVLFYDNFPAGYLMSSLRPATRSLFIHPVPYGIWDRELYTQYYRDPQKRPDVFFQFESFPFAMDSVMTYRSEWTKPPYDTFFDDLPLSGEYELVQTRRHYRVWKKKSLL